MEEIADDGLKISELIKLLEEAKEKYGDINVHYDYDGMDSPFTFEDYDYVPEKSEKVRKGFGKTAKDILLITPEHIWFQF
jgi:hypothetical protein